LSVDCGGECDACGPEVGYNATLNLRAAPNVALARRDEKSL
jgi:hypothetical protein